MCKNGKCVNTKGSFKCICDDGYDVDEMGKACEGMCELNVNMKKQKPNNQAARMASNSTREDFFRIIFEGVRIELLGCI